MERAETFGGAVSRTDGLALTTDGPGGRGEGAVATQPVASRRGMSGLVQESLAMIHLHASSGNMWRRFVAALDSAPLPGLAAT